MCEFMLMSMFDHPVVKPHVTEFIPRPRGKNKNTHGKWVERMLRINGIDATHTGDGRVEATPEGFVPGWPKRKVIVVIQIMEVLVKDLRCSMDPIHPYDDDKPSHEAVFAIGRALHVPVLELRRR